LTLIMSSLRDLPWRVVVHRAQRQDVAGLEVRVLSRGDDAHGIFRKVADALKLVEDVAPYRLARLRRDLTCILVTQTGGAHYLPRLRVCRLGIDMIGSAPTAEIAMTIIHEGTHARLWSAGFESEERCRERIERLCVRAEVAFAERIPGTEALVAKTEELLESRWWTRERRLESGLTQLRRLGAPEWFVRCVGFLYRRG
jgi:hypothetical protein